LLAGKGLDYTAALARSGRREVFHAMMAQIRAFAKSPIATVLLGLLMVSFLALGVRGIVSTTGAQDQVIKAGSRPAVTSAEFKDRFNFYKQQLEQQNHQEIPMQEAIKANLDRQVADELAFSESFSELFNRAGVKPSDELIVQWLRKNPRFFNPITGQFDKAAYAELLAQNNMTPAQADAELRDEITQRQFVSGMAAGLRAPLAYAAMQAVYLREARSFQYFSVASSILGPPVKPTDAQLNAFIKQNAPQLMKPELRVLDVVRFSAAALAPTITPSDAEIQKRFNFEKDTLSSPERRSFVEIPAKDAQSAAAIAAKLKSGADPQAVAKSYGVQAVSYADQPKAGVADKGVAAAAFSMKPGETSAMVQGDFGPAVIRLFSITPGHDANLAQARPKIEEEVKTADAQQKAYDLLQKYEDAHQGGADMATSAKTVNLPVAQTTPITAQGVDIQGQSANLPPKVLQTAFSLPQGADSDAITAGPGEYYLVHVAKVEPPALPTLDEIRPKLTRFFILRDAATKLRARAEALQASIQKGQSLEDAAKSVGATVQDAKDVLRSAGGQGQPYSTDLIGRVFQAQVGDVVVGQDVKLGFVLAKLDKISPPDPKTITPLVLAQRGSVTKSLFEDIGQATRVAARAAIKPKVDYAKARQALGVDPSQGAPSP
jgi:peptidyl-prolyl cis-trans isomerase D